MKQFSFCILIILLGYLPVKGNDSLFYKAKDWDEVIKVAKAYNRLIFVDVYATWCGPCKRMDKEVYTNDSIINKLSEKFIAIKIQMDQTPKDGEFIKRWYADASSFQKRYKIEVLPSYLFFLPNGDLFFMDIGFKDSEEFQEMISNAVVASSKDLLLNLENYKNGRAINCSIRDLSSFVKNIIRDKDLSKRLAREYLDSLNAAKYSAYDADKLHWFSYFNGMLKTTDMIFLMCYNSPTQMDSIIGEEGWSSSQVYWAIIRDMLENKLVVHGKPRYKNINWEEIEISIEKKYNKIDVKSLVLEYQIIYYREVDNNWSKWALCMDEKINMTKIIGGLDSFNQLNIPAWDAFSYCSDTSVLKMALKWSEKSIQLKNYQNVDQELDTKANLLYKLGKVTEAIKEEEIALAAAKKFALENKNENYELIQEFKNNLDKMRKGQKTWPVE